MAADFRVGDQVDLEITITEDGVAVDISGASTKTMTIERPDGTTADVAAAFTTDGTDGKIIITDYTMDQNGVWRREGFVDLPTGDFTSTKISWTVEPTL